MRYLVSFKSNDREKELEKLKKDFDDVMKDYRKIKEKEEIQEVWSTPLDSIEYLYIKSSKTKDI